MLRADTDSTRWPVSSCVTFNSATPGSSLPTIVAPRRRSASVTLDTKSERGAALAT